MSPKNTKTVSLGRSINWQRSRDTLLSDGMENQTDITLRLLTSGRRDEEICMGGGAGIIF